MPRPRPVRSLPPSPYSCVPLLTHLDTTVTPPSPLPIHLAAAPAPPHVATLSSPNHPFAKSPPPHPTSPPPSPPSPPPLPPSPFPPYPYPRPSPPPPPEARHDHDDRDLHGALHRHHTQIGSHPARDLLRIGLRLLYLEIEPEIGRQQVAKPLHREHGDDSERGNDPPEFGIAEVGKPIRIAKNQPEVEVMAESVGMRISVRGISPPIMARRISKETWRNTGPMMKPMKRSMPVHSAPVITCTKLRNQRLGLKIAAIITAKAAAAATRYHARSGTAARAGAAVRMVSAINRR